MQNKDNVIMESGTPTNEEFALNLKNKIIQLKSNDISIKQINHLQYKENYIFGKNEELADIDFFYKNKGIISKIIDKTQTPFSIQLCGILNQLNKILLCGTEREFKNTDIEKIILEFCNIFKKENINFRLESKTEYHTRCYFELNNENAVFDIYCNKNCEITEFRAQKSLSNSINLIEKIKMIAEENSQRSSDEC